MSTFSNEQPLALTKALFQPSFNALCRAGNSDNLSEALQILVDRYNTWGQPWVRKTKTKSIWVRNINDMLVRALPQTPEYRNELDLYLTYLFDTWQCNS